MMALSLTRSLGCLIFMLLQHKSVNSIEKNSIEEREPDKPLFVKLQAGVLSQKRFNIVDLMSTSVLGVGFGKMIC